MVEDTDNPARVRVERQADDRAPLSAARYGRLVGWSAAVVLALAIALVAFVQAAHWLAQRDIGSARGPLLHAAAVIAQDQPLAVGAGVFAAGALLAVAQDSIMSRRTLKLTRLAVAEESSRGDQEPGDQAAGKADVPEPAADADAGTRTHSPQHGLAAPRAGPKRPRLVPGRRRRPANGQDPGLVLSQMVRQHRSSAGDTKVLYAITIQKLGSDILNVRIGAIYALERLARDPATDHPALTEVLAAFIREHSREQSALRESGDLEQEQRVRPDVQAALSVIGRRTQERDITPDLVGASLTFAFLSRAFLRGAFLSGADLTGADLTSADLSGAHLVRAKLHGAHLTSADLTVANLVHANLHGANLTSANPIGADLSGANLVSANLHCADLTWANLIGGDLTGADLTRADLTGADLTGADLTGADLTGANLSGADLTWAVLTGADLTDARWPQQAAVPVGWKVDTGTRQTGSDCGAS